METVGMTKSYQDGSSGYIPTSSEDESSPHRLAFQRCHRLQARLEAVSAGLCELNMLRERQERLVKEAMCLPLSCVDDGETEKEEEEEGEEEEGEVEEEEEKNRKEARKETAFGNKLEHKGKFTDPTQLMGDLVERLEIIGEVSNTPDVSINSEPSSRKSSGFFEALDTDIFMRSRKNSVAELSDICPDMTTSGELRRVEESGRKLSEYSIDGDVSRFARNRAESSSLPDYNAITRATFAWNLSAGNVIATENNNFKSVGRSLSMKTARKLSDSGDTGPVSKPTIDGSMIAKRRPCLIRSISVPEPRNHINTESISREELIRRKRRSVHEIDFSLQGQPGLASQCYMGSSKAFRYPSPLHAISLQSPLCLPGPGYDEQQTEIDSMQVLRDSGTQDECRSGTTTKEKSRVGKSEQSFEVLEAEIQATTRSPCPSPAVDGLMDHRFSPTKCDTKLIPHSGKTKAALPLSSRNNSILIVEEKSQNKTCHMSVDMEHKNQNDTNSSVNRTNRKPRPMRNGVQEQDIEAVYNYNNMVTSYDSSAHPVRSCKQKPSNFEKISSKDTNFKRSQNDFESEKGDVRYTKQQATVRQEYFQDTEWLSPGRKSGYPNRENRHVGGYLSRKNRNARANLSTARNSHIDADGHYNDGVVRSKTPIHQSLSRADGRQSGASSGMKERQRMVENVDDSEQDDVPRPKPKRKNASVTPVEIWRVEYGV